jgi:polyvinyl alcohol dehydrogenase (cytochrome)
MSLFTNLRGSVLAPALLAALLPLTASAAPNNPHAESAEANADVYRDKVGNVDAETMAQGQKVYDGLCINCHESGANRAPQRFLLSFMTPESILRAMTDGVMREMTAHLSLDDKVAVSEFLSARKLGTSAEFAPTLMCEGPAAQFDRNEPPVFAGWGLDHENTHNVSTERAGINRANVGSLKLKYALAYPMAVRARSQPALAGGAVFVGSHSGTVYALDRETGCARWTFDASAEVRNGIVVQNWEAGDASANPLVFFGDLIGNQYALEAFTGELVWRKRMDDHHATTLTGTPALVGDTLYVPVSSLEEGSASNPEYPCCSFRGSLVALAAASGTEMWRTFLVDEPKPTKINASGTQLAGPSGVPIWTAPAVDHKRGLLYVTTGDNYSTPATDKSDSVVAIDMQTGAIKWYWQATEDDAWNGSCEEKIKHNCPDEGGPDHDYPAGPVLTRTKDGKEVIVASDKAGLAVGLEAETGKLLWKNKVGRGGVVGGTGFGLAAVDGAVFVPMSDVPDGRSYPEPARPGVYALDVTTGDFIWKAPSPNDVCQGRAACYPGYSGAISSTPELVVAGSNDGYVRIFDTASGEVLWQYDTTQTVSTVSGDQAKGGSMSGGAAPILYDGLLFVNSGYAFAGKMPGNVMLVFEVAGR